jgi:hypothetical protein
MPDTDREDLELIFELSRANSLAEKPGKNNWIEKTSDEGLPDYISRIAKALIRGGKSKSTAIAIAISRVKAWAAGGDDVNADTKAKAAAALAAWEKLKASNKARSKKVGLTNSAGKLVQVIDPHELIALSVSYSMDSIRAQFEQQRRAAREARRQATGKYDDSELNYLYIKEVWTDKVIAKGDYGDSSKTYRIDYTVNKNGEATFGTPEEVKVKYVTVKALADSEGEVASLSAENVDEWLERSERAAILRNVNKVKAVSEKLTK